MYAIIQSGGKQYRVKKGQVVDVERLKDAEGEQTFAFPDTLFVHDGEKSHVGADSLARFSVEGEIVGPVKGKKVRSLKYKRSHNQCRKWGHRQTYTRVRITHIGKAQGKKKGASDGT